MENHEQGCCDLLQSELEQLKERHAYLMADFENQRRRDEKERMHRIIAAQMHLLRDLLMVVDNFERALPSNQDRGIDLVYKELLKLLERNGVTEIVDHATFDPHLHEAIAYVPDAQKEPGSIVQVLQKGYRFKGELLRPAHVSVAAEAMA